MTKPAHAPKKKSAVEAVKDFCKDGLVIEAGRSKKMLAIAAITAVAAVGGVAAQTKANFPGALDSAAYTQMVAEVQAQADRELGEGRVIVLNRAASPAEEMRRLERKMPGIGSYVDRLRNGSGASTLNALVDDKPVCIVAGGTVGQTPKEFFSIENGPSVDVGDITARDVALYPIWRGIGHCLNGPSDAAAETFAALMAVRESASEHLLPMRAAQLEHNQWTNSVRGEDYWTASAVSAVAEFANRSGRMVSDSDLSWNSLAQRAQTISKGTQESRAMKNIFVAVSETLKEIEKGPIYYFRAGLITDRGSLQDWKESTEAPEIQRIVRLERYMAGDRTGATPVEPFYIEAQGSLNAMYTGMKKGEPGHKKLYNAYATALAASRGDGIRTRSPDETARDILARAEPLVGPIRQQQAMGEPQQTASTGPLMR